MSNEIERRLATLEAQHVALKEDTADIRTDVKELLEQMHKAQGGFWTLIAVGGAVSTVTGALAGYLAKNGAGVK